MVLLKDIIEPLKCTVLCGEDRLGTSEVTGGYACDLLSWVISRVQTGEVWMTILSSVNVVAVAVLAECSCILLTEEVTMDESVLERAREKGITVLSTPLPTYRACAILADLVDK
jgi:BioD-like phosphotransacetylase family protein